MEITLGLILAYIILIPFIIMNIAIMMGTFFQHRFAQFTRKALGLEEEFEQRHSKLYGIIYTVVWLAVGIAGLFTLDNPLSLGGFMVLLAFRGGANLGKRVVFGLHDRKLIKQKSQDTRIMRLVSLALQMGLIVEILFLLIWGLSYNFLYYTVRTTLGVDVNILMIALWIAGLAFGFIYAYLRGRLAQGFLLKDEIGIVLFLSGRWLESKIKEKTKFFPFFPW